MDRRPDAVGAGTGQREVRPRLVDSREEDPEAIATGTGKQGPVPMAVAPEALCLDSK